MEEKKATALRVWYGAKAYRVGDTTHVGFISGESGAGKSILSESIIASALRGSREGIWDVNVGDKAILHVDTEQPEDIADEMQARIQAKTPSEEFFLRYNYVNLTKFAEPSVKFEEFQQCIHSTLDLGLVVCDNLSDLISDINDQLQANKLASKMAQLAMDYKCLILFLAHTNNENTIKGAAGKRIRDKSSFGFNLTLDRKEGLTLVENVKSRYGWVPSTDFIVDQETKELSVGPYLPFPTK